MGTTIRAGLVIGLLLGLATNATGRTWRVEQNGSGDFTAIQAAVDAAAPGDTVRIGPGLFAEDGYIDLPGGQRVPVNLLVAKDNLVIAGSGPDATWLGSPTPWSMGPVSYTLFQYHAPRLVVTGMTIAGSAVGIEAWQGRLELGDCVLRGCGTGIHDYSDQGLLVENCTFRRSMADGAGLVTFSPARDIVVRNCAFDSDLNIADGSVNALVSGCSFGGGTALGVTVNADAVIADNRFDRTNGIFVGPGCRATLTGNLVGPGAGSALHVDLTGTVTGSGNVFAGGDPTIAVSGGSLTLHGCHILNGGHDSVTLSQFYGSPVTELDLTGNYWGTTDADAIAAWIHDGHDSPAIHAFVEFSPYAGQPLGTESRSWGAVKALYGR